MKPGKLKTIQHEYIKLDRLYMFIYYHRMPELAMGENMNKFDLKKNLAIEIAKEMYVIDGYEKLSAVDAAIIADDCIQFKEHNIYVINLEGMPNNEYWSHYICTFKNGLQLKYLHEVISRNSSDSINEVINKIKAKIYTYDELLQASSDYHDQCQKINYINNYFPYSLGAVSLYDSPDTEIYPFRCFLYAFKTIADKDAFSKAFIISHNNKTNQLNNLEFFKQAVSYELSNHEACITYEYNETLDSLGLTFDNLSTEKQQYVIDELHRQVYSYGC